MHPTFKDAAHEAAFRRQGYVVTDFFDDATVSRLRREVEGMLPPSGGFSTSVEIVDADYRAQVHAWLTEVFAQRASELLVDHDMNLTAVAVKWPGAEGLKSIHQDWTLSDESRFRAVNVWVPLVDTDRSNGALAVLPGSHAVLDRLRPAPRFPRDYDDPLDALTMDDLELVELRAGQAIAFDLALVHGSPPNDTSEPRSVIAANFLPRAAEAYYHYCDEDDLIDRFLVPDMEFFRRFDFKECPTGLERWGRVEFCPTTITANGLLQRSREHVASAL